ncbi:MAG: hypothetical protein QM687_06860 [Ferruginibacter sp.]
MIPSPKIIENVHQRFGWAEMLVFALLTALSVYAGQVSIFYIIYLFWWNELIVILTDYIFSRWQQHKNPGAAVSSLGGLFLLFVYFIFIVIFFAFMANWENEKLLVVNMRILFFKNLYFNLNLLYLAAMRIILLLNKQVKPAAADLFTPNMMVLHISIIFGGFLMFLVIKKYPQVFTPDNLWGSVLIIAPFLLLRFFVQLWKLKRKET